MTSSANGTTVVQSYERGTFSLALSTEEKRHPKSNAAVVSNTSDSGVDDAKSLTVELLKMLFLHRRETEKQKKSKV